MAAPIMHGPYRCVEPPNAIVQPVKAGTLTRIDSADSARVNEKK
jgi:hypothetical protein